MEELNGRKIAFPQATSFAELFDESSPAKGSAPILATYKSWEAGTWSDRAGRTRAYLTGHLGIHDQTGYRYCHVKPNATVMEFVEQNALKCSSDNMTFQIHVHADGQALVVLQHGVIIGNHYLALIDAATIPQPE